jgi:hypothetical protein
METAHALEPWYVTGFVEGAGSFTFNRVGDRLTLVFAVRLKSSNRPVLERLRDYFAGAGRIYETARANEEGEATGATCLFRINRVRDLLRVVEHFDKHPLRGSKREAYALWREMVFLRATHLGGRAPDQLARLARRLAEHTRKGRKTR